ncbi:MAG: hypothetical protein R3Y27_01785 [Clostridia bacterium]
MNTAELICASSKVFYNQLQYDSNGRYKSWEHCYLEFYQARNKTDVNIDILSLHLAFYLASWGMYRGSSFLLQKDYKVHKPVVEEILKEKYDALFGIECHMYNEEKNQILLKDLSLFLQEYYDVIRRDIKGNSLQSKLSDVLITKVLMGTLGCVPAYDRYFIAGIKSEKVASGNYNVNSIMKLVDFYELNKGLLELTREQMIVGDILYPQMKLIDMGFWQIGYEMDIDGR